MPSYGVATIEIIPGTGQIIDQDIWGNIIDQLYQNSPAIAYELRTMVVALTPLLSGSLISDITWELAGTPSTGNSGSNSGEIDLFWVYTEQVHQQAYWDRAYAVFQEGGLLGQPTYTNAPHQMFLDTASGDGLAAVEAWAIAVVSIANGISVAGSGVAFNSPPFTQGSLVAP